ncbi:MAG: DUF4968 domain-containing protein [Lachnospiraceae bacterium]|nr:DUF4968 domain-containing protein [Lachnospiraceae bacterium]
MNKYGNIKEWKTKGNETEIIFENQRMIVTVINDEIINVFVPIWSEDHRSKAIEKEDYERASSKGCCVESAEKINEFGEKSVEISTSEIKLIITDGGFADFYSKDGKLISAEYRENRKPIKTLGIWEMELLRAEGHTVADTVLNKPVNDVRRIDLDERLYGLGDKMSFLDKRSYEYENWNTDDPSAHNEQYHSLYKSIPFLICKKRSYTYGLFYDNTFHSYFDLAKENPEYMAYSAEDGNLDLYFIGGGNIKKVVENYTDLTGKTPLPQLWTLGYHQCRWGYSSTKDIMEVADKFRELDIPCESVQFDIDYMDGYRVFTWNEKDYGPKGKLFKELSEKGFKQVVIIDPGTKREEGYFMYEEGTKNGYFFKDSDGKNDYVNAVWPGDANYPDFGRDEVRKWWGSHVNDLTDMGVDAIWNDMNEPASFNGPLPLDVIGHDEDRETTHRELHNVYGHFMSKATYEAMKEHTGKRPLVITRACYSGSQKYAAVWTGDNQSLWPHLAMMIPQLCTLGMCGFSICGVDIGGFGTDSTPELLSRWIEAASFATFFRNHSANGSIRQEPWKFGERTVEIYRKYVKQHYTFLPYLYDLMYEEQTTGLPVMRPLVMEYEDDENTYNLNDEFMVGDKILVSPVVNPGETVKKVYLPKGTWYRYPDGEKIDGGRYILEDAPLDYMPVYIKEGSVIPTYKDISFVGEKLPDKLILLTTPGGGKCNHFKDSGTDYSYKKGKYNLYEFEVDREGKLNLNIVNESQDVEQYSEIAINILKKT